MNLLVLAGPTEGWRWPTNARPARWAGPSSQSRPVACRRSDFRTAASSRRPSTKTTRASSPTFRREASSNLAGKFGQKFKKSGNELTKNLTDQFKNRLITLAT
jgi:hypothetical protein